MNFDILILFTFYFVCIFSIIGFGLLFQKLVGFPSSKNCIGYHGIFGLFSLILYSYFSNLFYPHNLIHNTSLIFIGMLSFYLFYFKKNYMSNEFRGFLLIFFVLFISFLLFKTHDDFPYYHFPYTYYLTQNSFLVGAGSLNHGFRTPSSLFYLNSLFYLPVVKFYLFHIGAISVMGFSLFIFIQKIILNLKKNKIDFLYYLNLTFIIFIIIFFYRLSEHGTDRSAQILILLIIYEIFVLIKKKEISKNDIAVLSILFAVTISMKLFYLLYILFLIPIVYKCFITEGIKFISKIFKNKIFYLSLALFLFVLFTNFINTGCLIYPIKQSCFFDFALSIELREVERMSLHYENWSKAGASPNYYVKNPELYVSNFNWVNNWINEYFFFKFTDFFLGIIFMILVFFLIFNSKQKKQMKNTNLLFFVYPIIIILLIEWFVNHPSLRYGGYSLVALTLLVPFSFKLDTNKLSHKKIKKNTIIILLIGISVFCLRNVDRLIDDTKKYKYNVLKNPYYKIEKSYFRIDTRLNNLITIYENCNKTEKSCDFKDEYKIEKLNGIYFFVKNK